MKLLNDVQYTQILAIRLYLFTFHKNVSFDFYIEINCLLMTNISSSIGNNNV